MDQTDELRASWVNEIAELGEPVRWVVYDEDEGLVPVFFDGLEELLFSGGHVIALDVRKFAGT